MSDSRRLRSATPTRLRGGNFTLLRRRSRSQGDTNAFEQWDIDETGKASVEVTAHAMLRVIPPAALPAAGKPQPVPMMRRSETYGLPTLTGGTPQLNWVPDDVTVEEWGRIRILVDGVDMTFFRDVPTQIEQFSSNDPFGDASASITFPQITIFEDPKDFIPEYAEVTIQLVRPNGEFVDLFDGMVQDYNDSDNTGTNISVLGAFYEADLLLRKPTFQDDEVDISNHINTTINGFIMLYALNLANMPEAFTGVVRRARGFFEKTATGYIMNLLGRVVDSSGVKWTVECYQRQPVLKERNTTDTHWTVTTGGRGIQVDLVQDSLADPNVIYGEGVEKDNLVWRNTKYPGWHDETAPLWPGVYFEEGHAGDGIYLWEQRMLSSGWTVTDNDEYDAGDVAVCMAFQEQAGLTVDGIIGPQTWAASFQIGSTSGDIAAAYIQALHWMPHVEPGLFAPDGGLIGLNPFYDPEIGPRIEAYRQYGTGISQQLAKESAIKEIRDNFLDKGWFGTLSLTSDPEEGSRFEIRAGQNIALKWYRGQSSILLHIAKADVDLMNGNVNLTVDTKFRDLPTLAAMKSRNDEALEDPASKYKTKRRSSYDTNDEWPIWDVEAKGGFVPMHVVQAGLWNVLRIPFGKYGEVVATDFQNGYAGYPLAEMAIGVFDRPIYPNTLRAYGSPMQEYEDDPDNPEPIPEFWDYFDEMGLLNAWGGLTNPGGYDPITTGNDEPPLTGRILDKSSWVYSSSAPPWLWVAIWTGQTTTVQGRFYPGAQSGEALPVLYGPVTPGSGGEG